MDQEQDIAKSPVGFTDDSGDYQDTGVLHEGLICVNCGNDDAAQGMTICTECAEQLGPEADKYLIRKG